MKVLETEVELAEARQLAVKSILALHPLFKVMPPDLQEIDDYFKYMIAESSRCKLAWGYYADGKMVAFLFCYPMKEYLRLQPPPFPKSKVLQYMQPYEKKLNEDLSRILTEKNEMEKGLMCEWLVIDPDYKKKEVGALVLYLSYKIYIKLGWRYFYGMSTNPTSLNLLRTLTGQVLSEVTLEEEPFKGRKFQIIRVDIEELRPMIEHMKFSATPKL